MLYHASLSNYFEENFALLQHHKWSLSDIENLIPWERETYIKFLTNYIEKKNLEVQQEQNAQSNW